MLVLVGGMQLGDQLVEPRRQDDEKTGCARSGVPERVWNTGGHEDRRTRIGDNYLIIEAEPKCSGHDVPCLVVQVVDVKRSYFAG